MGGDADHEIPALVGERFWRVTPELTIDLAFRCAVHLTVWPAPAAVEAETTWRIRCERLLRLRHPRLVPLVDFGRHGPADRFEAYARHDHAADERTARHSVRALASALRRLHRAEVLLGSDVAESLVVRDGVPCLRSAPRHDTPFTPAARRREQQSFLSCFELSYWPWDEARDRAPSVLRGVRETTSLAIETAPAGSLRHVHVHGRSERAVRVAVELAVRDARLRGYVPVDLSLWLSHGLNVAQFAAGHVLLVADAASASVSDLAAALLPPRGSVEHVACHLLTYGRRPIVGAVNFPGDPATGRTDRRGSRLFSLRLDLPAGEGRRHLPATVASSRGAATRVAEGSVPYRTLRPSGRIPSVGDAFSGASVAPAEAARFAVCGRRAVALAAAGRLSLASTKMSAAIAALERRRAFREAASLAQRFGDVLLSYGHAEAARRRFESALSWASASGDLEGQLRSSVGIGLALTDAGAFTRAERILRSSLLVAGHVQEGETRVAVACALGRCLFWRGGSAEAAVLLADTHSDDDEWRVRVLCSRARIAVTQGQPEGAAMAEEAVQLARRCRSPDAWVRSRLVAMLARAAAGDVEGLSGASLQAFAAARLLPGRLWRRRTRITLLEGLIRARAPAAGALARRLAWWQAGSLPPLFRARWQMALAHAGGGNRHVFAVRARAFIERSGAHGLEHWYQEAHAMPVVEELLEVLRVAQEPSDDVTVLRRICEHLRARLEAAAVTVVGDRARLAHAGREIDTSEAGRRARETGLPIAPFPTAGSLQAAAPIRYSGATLGTLACAWPLGAMLDARRTEAFLSTAATACGPLVRGALDQPAFVVGREPANDLGLVGRSSALAELRLAIVRAASAPFPVLIEGESGSGKELVARAIHRLSPRHGRRFCALNCAALSDELLEAELFGHARGAFTGAVTERAGLFEEADGGLLFLDEIGELSARAQAKLLRVLQEGECRRVGENAARRVDVRVIAATNRSLSAEMAAGRFRADLVYRLDVVRITVLPLRDRPDDIVPLAIHFWQQATSRIGSRATLDPAVLAALARYDWPGNVRELQNVLSALAVRAPRRGRVGPDVLPEAIAKAHTPSNGTLEEARRGFERRFVRAALARAGGHRSRAAADLGLSRQGLAKLLARLDLAVSVREGFVESPPQEA